MRLFDVTWWYKRERAVIAPTSGAEGNDKFKLDHTSDIGPLAIFLPRDLDADPNPVGEGYVNLHR